MIEQNSDRKQPHFEKHPDDEWYDEIRIITVPRYKTSGLSGDEWRFSYQLQLLRKGLVLYQRNTGKLRWAIEALPWFVETAGESDTFKTSDYDQKMRQLELLCANPGCRNEAVSIYRFKKLWCSFCGKAQEQPEFTDHMIRFCQEHLRRGDCGLHDADTNYEVVSGPGPRRAAGYEDKITESVFAGILKLDHNIT